MQKKVIILGSEDCGTCAEIKSLIEKSGSDVEYVNVDSDEGFEKAKEMAKRGLKLDDYDVPKCVISYEDGTFATCDEEDLIKRLKEKTGG